MPRWIKGIITKNSHLSAAIGLLLLSSGILTVWYAAPYKPVSPQITGWRADYLVPANAAETPMPFIDSVIWHSPGQPYLSLRSLNDSTEKILDFVNGIPIWWDIATTRRADNVYHLVWRNDDGRLWRTLIDPNGNITLAVIEVAPNTQQADISTSGDGRSILAWRSEGRLGLLVMDVFGRPLVTWENVAQGVDDLAAFPSPEGYIYLAWVQGRQIHTAVIDDLIQQPASVAYPLHLPDTQWAESLLLIGGDNGPPDILWFLHDIAAPDSPTLRGITWFGQPLDLTFASEFKAIGLPRSFQPRYGLPVLTVAIDEQAAWLRWDERVLYPLDGPPANLSAPRLWFDTLGNLRSAAWSTADAGRLYHTITYPQQRTVQAPSPTTRQWLSLGLRNAYRAIGWLLLPLFLTATGYTIRQQVSYNSMFIIILSSYFMLKILLAPTGLYMLSPMQEGTATSGVFVLLVGISGLSLTLATAVVRPIQWVWPLIFSCTDALFTWIVFGAHLS